MDSMPLTPDGEELDDYMDFFSSNSINKKKNESLARSEHENGVCFNCKGDAQQSNLLLRDSFQGREYLSNLIITGDPCLFHETENIIFGKRICLSQLHHGITHYFMVLKKNVNILEEQSKSGIGLSNYNAKKSSFNIRKDIANFFLLLSTHIKKLKGEDEDFRIVVISEIFDLLRFINPFCSSSQYITGISSPLGNQCSSGMYHYFHAQLDIRWWAMCIIHQIDASSVVAKVPDDVEPLVEELSLESVTFLSAFDSCASFVAWDIILLVHRQIMNTDVIENNRIQRFPCTCVHELASSLLHILDHRANLFKQKSFWDLIKDKLLVLMKMVDSSDRKIIPVIAYCPWISPDSCARISLKQVWLIFVELAKLYDWNANGLMVSDRSDAIKAEPKLLKTLIRFSLKDSCQSEGEIRFYLQSCLVLMNLWQKDKNSRGNECVTVIWEYMVKNLNSCFFSGKTTLEGFSNQRKSPEEWFKQLNYLDSDPNSTEKNHTSWIIFLKLIIGQLHSEGNWKVLQGRIYSKFHERKMLELNGNGIYNTVSLFLTIGLHGDLFVLCSKLLELLAFIPNIEVSKLRIVFNGLFTVALTLFNKCSDLSPVTKCLEARLSAVCKAVSGASKDRREFGTLVVFYAEATSTILEQSDDFSLSQEKLLCAPLAELTGRMPSERSTVFSTINCALKTIIKCSDVPHLLSDGRCLHLLMKLWKQYGTNLRCQPSATDATRISNVAASFVVCCIRLTLISDSEASSLKDIATELFARFINSDSSCDQMSQNFIIEIMIDKTAINNAIRLFPDLEGKIINYSISTLVTCGATSDVSELFEAIFLLPGIVNLVPDANCHPFQAVVDLLVALAEEFQTTKEFKTRLAAREKANVYFNSLEKSILAVVDKTPVPHHIHEIMSFVVKLFQKGSQIFYLKGKPNCLLANILNKLILPTSIYSADKPLVKTVADAYILLIPEVLAGLVNLNPSCDPYIQRCFRDVIIHYLYRFPPTDHPFLVFFGYDKSRAMRILFLEIARDCYITKRKCPISHLHILFELLLRLSSKEKEWTPLICKNIFLNVLDLLLILDESNAKFINNFLRKLFHQDDVNGGCYRFELLEGIRKFVSCQMKFKSKKVFAILMSMCEINESLIADSMEKILAVICETEEKRGSGHDAVLRKGYSDLENKLEMF